MCEKCVEIDKIIKRFRLIDRSISELLTVERAQEVIDDLEAEKIARHLCADAAAKARHRTNTRVSHGEWLESGRWIGGFEFPVRLEAASRCGNSPLG